MLLYAHDAFYAQRGAGFLAKANGADSDTVTYNSDKVTHATKGKTNHKTHSSFLLTNELFRLQFYKS